MIFVLIESDIAVVVDGVAHHERGSSVETRREVIYHRSTLVEDHVETQTVVTLFVIVLALRAVSSRTALKRVVLVNHEVGHGREVEQPLRVTAEYEVVAVAATNGKIGKGEVYVWSLRTALNQRVGSLDATALETGSRQPRACRATLIVVLIQSCGEGEAAVVETVIGCHIDDIHAQSFLVQMVYIAQLHVTRQRRGALVVDVETDAIAVVFEIELIVESPRIFAGLSDSETARSQ